MSALTRERRAWTAREDQMLRNAVEKEDPGNPNPSKWHAIAKHVPNRTNKDCRKRWFAKMASDVVKGGWAPDEDQRLMSGIELHGTRWSLVASIVGTRNSDQCAKRWTDTLNPAIDRTSWTPDADSILIDAVKQYGKVWTKIVKTYFPGRTGLSAKNRYNSITRFGAENSRTRNRRRPLEAAAPYPSEGGFEMSSLSPPSSGSSSPRDCSPPAPASHMLLHPIIAVPSQASCSYDQVSTSWSPTSSEFSDYPSAYRYSQESDVRTSSPSSSSTSSYMGYGNNLPISSGGYVSNYSFQPQDHRAQSQEREQSYAPMNTSSIPRDAFTSMGYADRRISQGSSSPYNSIPSHNNVRQQSYDSFSETNYALLAASMSTPATSYSTQLDSYPWNGLPTAQQEQKVWPRYHHNKVVPAPMQAESMAQYAGF